MTTTSEDQWRTLAVNASGRGGASWVRVQARSKQDLFLAVSQPGGHRCVWFDLSSDALPPDLHIESLRAIHVRMGNSPLTTAKIRVELVLEDPDLNDVFRALADDVVTAVGAAPSDEDGLVQLTNRLARWRRLLAPSGVTGLTLSERRGLVGELSVLALLLDVDMDMDPFAAVSSWTGPYGRHQDFQSGTGALEVKTTVAKQPQALIITSERELDDVGLATLALVHLSMDERRGGTGKSLVDLVSGIAQRLRPDAAAVELFQDALLHVGYLTEHEPLYTDLRYAPRAANSFGVADGFPRIVESSLAAGVGDVRYRIQLAALAPFSINHDAVLRRFVRQ